MSFKYPMPAIAPTAPHRLSTSKDADGNTIIHLDRAGKPVDITVKNGEVWVDGQRVEDGKSLELPESGDANEWLATADDGKFEFHSADNGQGVGTFYRNDGSEPVLVPSPDNWRQSEMNRVMTERTWKISKKEKQKQEKAMEKAEKEMRKAEVEMEKQQRKMEESLQKMQEQDAFKRKQFQERRTPQ